MKVVEALDHIRPNWMTRVSHRLARGEELRENFEQALSGFYQLLQQAVVTGDAAWLNPVLDEWIQSRTQTELEAKEYSLPPILHQMLLITNEICLETLEQADAVALMQALTPIFLCCSEYAAREEIKLHIEHITSELDQVSTTLARLDKSKSDFIAIAAHELKTPLTLIEGYAAMLRDKFPEGEDFEYTRVLLKGIDNGTRRLQEIVDDLIDVSLIDNNLLSLRFQPVWLNRIFEVIVDEFEQAIEERHQVFKICDFPGIDEMTLGDEERLFQAFRNLFSNAIKYTPDGGRITVDGRKLSGFVEVTVADTGIGIAIENHTRIFEKFGGLGSVLLHSSGKTKYKGGGAGLGLPITKGIIEAHGGSIWVESEGFDELNCPGSIFHVLLPVHTEPPDEKVAKLFSSMLSSDAT